MIGHLGSRLCKIAAAARHQIEAFARDPGLSRSAGEGAQGVETRLQHLEPVGLLASCNIRTHSRNILLFSGGSETCDHAM
jgi:hypothetical protein